MEEQLPETLLEDDWVSEFARRVDEQRDRMREQLRQKKQHAREIESALARQIQTLHDELAAVCAKVDRQDAELETKRGELERLESQTKRQRRDVARRLRTQRTEMLAEIETCRAEAVRMASSDEADVKKQLAEAARLADQKGTALGEKEQLCAQLQEQLDELREENEILQHKLSQQSAADAGEVEELRKQSQELTAAKKEAAELRAQIEELQAQVEESGRADSESAAELGQLRQENEALAARLAEAEARAEQAAESGADSEEVEDLRQRLEMALDDVRTARDRNAKLEKDLKAAQASGGGAVSASSDGLDWESQKRRMLEQLESDFDEEDEEQAEAKLTVEGTIQITDQVVAEKEQEIEELKRLLEQQSGNIGDVAVGAAAIAAALDQDELIRQERENLKVVQSEWREKLRVAEVDISMERAKLARERTELDEKIEQYESMLKKFESAAPSGGADSSGGKQQRGRWLARLGLKGDEE